MKTSLDHLPENKQAELKKMVQIIRKFTGKAEMIILFGSYARGDYVESDRYGEGHIIYEYRSDMDTLIIVRDEKTERDLGIWCRIQDEVDRDKYIHTPVNIIVDTIDFVNEQLDLGRYFYRDMQKEGILLHDSKKFQLATPRKLTPKERKRLAEEDFEMWFENVTVALKNYEFNLREGKSNKTHLKKAAFELHQATEAIFTAILLVFTEYRPKTHDLEKLLKKVVPFDVRFAEVFPRNTAEEQALFLLLKEAYVKARYSKSYRITQEELQSLAERIEKLVKIGKEVCLRKIEGLGK